ncbi:hypothetical protein R3P38DRAFT_2776774 [Favolaschia claudopus]|uniref:Uncharacterized protein n=1 Tax=Favolaschia claudopus TaxID=2862362 RepID=A0AAW0BN01_9AGAR
MGGNQNALRISRIVGSYGTAVTTPELSSPPLKYAPHNKEDGRHEERNRTPAWKHRPLPRPERSGESFSRVMQKHPQPSWAMHTRSTCPHPYDDMKHQSIEKCSLDRRRRAPVNRTHRGETWQRKETQRADRTSVPPSSEGSPAEDEGGERQWRGARIQPCECTSANYEIMPYSRFHPVTSSPRDESGLRAALPLPNSCRSISRPPITPQASRIAHASRSALADANGEPTNSRTAVECRGALDVEKRQLKGRQAEELEASELQSMRHALEEAESAGLGKRCLEEIDEQAGVDRKYKLQAQGTDGLGLCGGTD